jgi:hypothetical protein
MSKKSVVVDEELQRFIEERAHELTEEYRENLAREYKQNWVRAEFEEEIKSWAEQLAEIKVRKLLEEKERADYIIDRQARELERLTSSSEVLREVLSNGGGIKELVWKLEEMKRKILQLEALFAEAKATQFPDLSRRPPDAVVEPSHS